MVRKTDRQKYENIKRKKNTNACSTRELRPRWLSD